MVSFNYVSVALNLSVDMDETKEAVIVSTAELDEHAEDTALEKPTSKRQLKLQKRREQWLSRKAERR